MTGTMDPNMTLTTGLDALSHTMESYWSKPPNAYTRTLARDSIRIIRKYLPLALNDLDNMEYRKQMLMGLFFAGLTFSNTRTTASHSISYPLTMMYGINHGFAVAITLFEVMKRNWEYILENELFLDAWDADNLDDILDWFSGISEGKINLRALELKRRKFRKLLNWLQPVEGWTIIRLFLMRKRLEITWKVFIKI